MLCIYLFIYFCLVCLGEKFCFWIWGFNVSRIAASFASHVAQQLVCLGGGQGVRLSTTNGDLRSLKCTLRTPISCEDSGESVRFASAEFKGHDGGVSRVQSHNGANGHFELRPSTKVPNGRKSPPCVHFDHAWCSTCAGQVNLGGWSCQSKQTSKGKGG